MKKFQYSCDLKINKDEISRLEMDSLGGFYIPLLEYEMLLSAYDIIRKGKQDKDWTLQDRTNAVLQCVSENPHVVEKFNDIGIKIKTKSEIREGSGIFEIFDRQKYHKHQDSSIRRFSEKFDMYFKPIYSLQIGNGLANLTLSSKNRKNALKEIADFKNTIYIPKTPSISFSENTKGRVFSSMWQLKNSNYYYINLDPDLYNADYAANYLNSKYGILQFSFLSSGKFIPYLSSSAVQRVALPVKSLDSKETLIDQSGVVDNLKVIKKIKENLKSLPEEIYYNNMEFNSDLLFSNIDNVKNKKLIQKDESITHELKSSLRYCYKTNKIQKYIPDQCLKAISAFLNTKGGTLLIGVRDNKTISGIEHDEFKNTDEFERFLQDKIKEHIGIKYLTNIDINFFSINEQTVCKVSCDPLPKEERCSFHDEIYIRVGPSSRKLNSKETADWIEKRLK